MPAVSQAVSYSWTPVVADSLRKRVLKFFGILADYEFIFCVDYRYKDMATQICDHFSLRTHLCPGEAVFGLLSTTAQVPPGFQVFSVYSGRRYLSPAETLRFCRHRGLPDPVRQ